MKVAEVANGIGASRGRHLMPSAGGGSKQLDSLGEARPFGGKLLSVDDRLVDVVYIGGLRFLECLLEWKHDAKGFAFMKLGEQDRYVSVRETFLNMRSRACPYGDVGSRQKHFERRY